MTDRSASNAATLNAAIKASAPGDRVLLASGDYGSVALNNLNVAAPGVTIMPAPGASPVFNNIEHSSSSGLHYKGAIEVWTRDPKQHNASYSVFAYASSDISLDGVKVHGPVAANPGPASGVGVFARSCPAGITVTNCEFFDLGVGASFMDCASPAFTGNAVHDVATDGIDIAGCSNPVVAANTFTDFFPAAGAHPDAIQLWGTPTNPRGTNARIADNIIERGKGAVMQGIFSESQDSLTVTGNAMSGTMYNGISVSTTNDATITGNFVQGMADMGTRIIARGGSTNVTVDGNTVSDAIINLVQAGEAPVKNFVLGTNITIKTAAVGDTSALDAWVAAKKSSAPPVVTPPPVITPPPVQPPPVVVAPPPVVVPPTPDPQIAVLTGQLLQATTALKTATQQVATLQDQLAASQAADAADEALLGQIRSALHAALGA